MDSRSGVSEFLMPRRARIRPLGSWAADQPWAEPYFPTSQPTMTGRQSDRAA